MKTFKQIDSTWAKAVNPVKNASGEIISADRMPVPKFEYQLNIDFSDLPDSLFNDCIKALIVKQVKEIVQSKEQLKTCPANVYKETLEQLVGNLTGQQFWDSLLGEDKGGVFGLDKFRSWVKPLFEQVKEQYKINNGKELDKQLASVYVSAFGLGQSMLPEVKSQIFSWVEKFGLDDEVTIKAVEWLSKEPAAKPSLPSSLI